MKTRLSIIPIVLLLLINACKKEGPCTGVVCQNGGICIDGVCMCDTGFGGATCEVVIPGPADTVAGSYLVFGRNITRDTHSNTNFAVTDTLRITKLNIFTVLIGNGYTRFYYDSNSTSSHIIFSDQRPPSYPLHEASIHFYENGDSVYYTSSYTYDPWHYGEYYVSGRKIH